MADDAPVRGLEAVHDGVPTRETLFDIVGDVQFVLIGEASHGTREFYEARATMTQWLLQERGFRAVAVEADWPDAYRVNRYVRGHGDDSSADEALGDFKRFPTWMWRNDVIREFTQWLRDHNATVGAGEQAGFYGLDLYSLHRSMNQVVTYLEGVDAAAADRARARYACFDHSDADDGQAYGHAAAFGAGQSCEDEVTAQLVDLHRLPRPAEGAALEDDERFHAEQNARTVAAAEEYYRSMFGSRVSSWNLRDGHMFSALEALAEHLGTRTGQRAKIVVWAHNSHVNDARATQMGDAGELTIGQLVREKHPDNCVLLGFTTHSGTVTAADDWGGAAQRKRVRPALPGSVEELFHGMGEGDFLVRFDRDHDLSRTLRKPLLHRAIGVIYRPQTERQSHYFTARVADQFDAVIHLDTTHAVEPLERTARWDEGEAPETYPFAV